MTMTRIFTAHAMLELIRTGYAASQKAGGKTVHAISDRDGSLRFVTTVCPSDRVVLTDIKAAVFESIADAKDRADIYNEMKPLMPDLERIALMIERGPDGEPRPNKAEFIEALIAMLVGKGTLFAHSEPEKPGRFTRIWRRFWYRNAEEEVSK